MAIISHSLHTAIRSLPSQAYIDARREAAIACAVDDLLSAPGRLHRIIACRALTVLVRARSPRQIRAIEQRRGLTRSAAAYVDGHYVGGVARREAA